MAYRNEKERMRNLNTFIIERLKLNKNSRVKDKLRPTHFFEFQEIIANKLKNLGDNKEYLDLKDLDISDYKGSGHQDERFDRILRKFLSSYNTKYDYNIKYIDVTGWDLTHIDSVSGLFHELQDIEEIIGVDDWDMSNVEHIEWIFSDCVNLKNIGNLGKWKFNNLKRAQGFIYGCQHLKTIGDISKWDMSNVNFLTNMFAHCYELQDVGEIGNWNLSSCISYRRMFYYANNLRNVGDLTKWNKYLKSNIQNIKNRYNGHLGDGFEEIFDNSPVEYDYDLIITEKTAKIKKLV